MKVVIKGLLRHLVFASCVLQCIPNKSAIWPQNAVVETAPKAYFVNDILDSSLFDSVSLSQLSCLEPRDVRIPSRKHINQQRTHTYARFLRAFFV